MRPWTLLSVCAIAALSVTALRASDDPSTWDVAVPHGPGRDLSFEVSEGTWMSVDVHPDGDRFVFDLLGDLYELPLSGGTAKRLTSGGAWDAEPRWSPDGETLLFTSDRGGNDNLWLADADGTRPRALTKETAVRMRDGAWTPDGEYVIARKRITDSSSIGVNELWMVHRLGGTGVQLTSKDALGGVMEPAVSPDGRYVYFSRRPGRYAYNPDPNRGIWQIGRFDRRTGQERPLTGEFGGAIRPTPSPDGKSLALIRRVRGASVLELYDLASGDRRQIADWLDRDGQEGFGNNQLYPRMDWTTDGRILLTAGGRFWLVDPADGARTEVPFTATVDAFLHEPVRPPRSPVADTVRARLVRWPVFAPDRDELLFAALGRIWRQKGPDGTPEDLAPARVLDGQRLYSPAWSPEGAFITFVSWDDALGGAVWVMPSRGPGKAKRVSALGPKYTNPSFSADATEIVVLRGSGAHLRDADLNAELWSDIVILDVTEPGTPEEIVTATRGLHRAVRPRFSPDGTRILFADEQQPQPRESAVGALISVARDGTDRRTVLTASHAVEVVPSPDGRWVAFVDGHQVWLSAVPEAGRETRAITPGMGATPGWRLSEEAGAWVDFAGGYVTWGYGPEIHRVPVADVVAWEEQRQAMALAGDDDDSADAEGADAGDDDDSAADGPELPPSEVWDLQLTAPRDVPEGVVALTNTTVLTMNGDEVLEGVTVLVNGDRIEAVGADVAVPPDAKRFDGSGTFVIPGLIDVHAHLHFSALDVLPAQEWRYLANLAYGVTTVHDPSAFSENVFANAELVETGAMWGPRVFSTGQILYGASGNFRTEVSTREDALRHLKRMKQIGAISVKSYQQPRRDQRQWIVEAGRAEDVLVIPEGGGDLFANLSMALDGHTSIEHAMPVAPLHDDVLTLFGATGLGYSPTLLVTYGGPFGENYFYGRRDVWADPKLQRLTPRSELDPKSRRPGLSAPDGEWYHEDLARAAADLARKGALVTLGAHGQLQGLGAHWELWALAGPDAMTPMEALRAATISGASYLGMDADLGTIEAGKLADLVVLTADPREDIENTAAIRWVMKNGDLYDGDTLHRLAPRPADRPTMIWEQ